MKIENITAEETLFGQHRFPFHHWIRPNQISPEKKNPIKKIKPRMS
jgi:hypothetical protein